MQRLPSLFPNAIASSLRHILPKTGKRVCVIGGGFAGLLCAERLRHFFDVTVVDKKPYFEFTPGLPHAVLQPWYHSRLCFDYRSVLEENMGVEFVLGKVAELTDHEGSAQASGAVMVGGRKVSFDYCVIAPGVANGIWKEHRESQDLRRQQLQDFRDEISDSEQVTIVGAGLVGVELAAEILHYMSEKRVQLYDGASSILANLPTNAQIYATKWLASRNADLLLSKPFHETGASKVIWCVGVESRNAFVPSHALDTSGYVRVNTKMQVLVPDDQQSTAGHTTSFQPYNHGRVFAVGDCTHVQGSAKPYTKTIFAAEEMAAIAVANIEALEDVALPNLGLRSIGALPFYCCTSLGPQDGIFTMDDSVLSSGISAALQKHLIETTKINALTNGFLGKTMWGPVH